MPPPLSPSPVAGTGSRPSPKKLAQDALSPVRNTGSRKVVAVEADPESASPSPPVESDPIKPLEPWTDDEVKKLLQLLKSHIGPLTMDMLGEAMQRSKFDIGVNIFTIRDSAETAASDHRQRVPWYLRRPILNQPGNGLRVIIPGDERVEATIYYPDGRVEHGLMRKGETFSH